MAFIIAMLVFFIVWRVLDRDRPRRPTAEDLTNDLDHIEVLLLKNNLPAAHSAIGEIEQPTLKLQGPGTSLQRSRFRMLAGEILCCTGREQEGRLQFERAMVEIDTIPDESMALEQRTRTRASLGLLTNPGDPDEILLAHGRRALEDEARVRRPDVLMRLVWIADKLARIEHLRGRWEVARVLFEHSVSIAGRVERPDGSPPDSAWTKEARELFWSCARSAGSNSARELGMVLRSLGDREAGNRWLEEATHLVENAERPFARLRLAQSLIDRAMIDPADAVAGIHHQEALLERAVEVGLSCKTPEGRTASCSAEAARASLYGSLGIWDKNVAHLRRALELTDEMKEPAASHNLAYLHMSIGFALEEIGDCAEAAAAYQRAMDFGGSHPDPETRKFALQSAYRLHRLHMEEDRTSDGRGCMELIERLVPTLGADERTFFAGIAVHSRGIQQVLENQADEARQSLERAEAIALPMGPLGLGLARGAATDLGRLAMRLDRHKDAEPHLRRAFEYSPGPVSATQDQAERAEILLLLSDALMGTERPEEAMRECSRAFELGRNGGNARGREVAALAALRLGEVAELPAERLRYFQTASRLGRLSGRKRGREVADAVDRRLEDKTSW